MAGRFSIEAIFKAIDGFSKPLAKMQSRFEAFSDRTSRSLKKVDQQNKAISDGIAKAAAITAVGATAAGFAIKSVVDTGSEFEEAITAVGAVSLMTRGEIADLEKKALELGSTTKFSATEVAKGMELMGRAGFTNAEILQGMPGILAAAAAEGATLEETAGNVSNVLKGMGLATSETTRVADVLTLASARTNSSITSLGESMANVAATARQFKIPLEDTVASVALLQDVGMNAAEAGSAMNTMLTRMAAPSDVARKQMKAFGVELADAHGNMLPLNNVLGQMEKAAQKSGGNMKQVAFFAELVGLRGQKAATNLKDLFMSGKFSALTKELEDAKGSAEKMAALRMDNFRGDLSKLEKGVDSFKIKLFDMNSGPLREVTQRMTKWVEANKEWLATKIEGGITWLIDNLPTIVKWLERIAIGIGIFYAWSTAIKIARLAMATYELAIKAVSVAKAVFTGVAWLATNAVKAFQVGQYLAGIATTAMATATGGATAAVSAFIIPVLAAVAAIGALMLAYTQWKKLSADTEGLGVTGTIGQMVEQGTWDPFKAVDTYQNEQAKKRAAASPASDMQAAAGVTDISKLSESSVGDLAKLTEGGVKGIETLTLGALQNIQNQAAAGPPPNPQVVSPMAGVSRSIEESTSTSRGEVTIVDQTGKAKITKPAKGSGFALTLQPSGGF